MHEVKAIVTISSNKSAREEGKGDERKKAKEEQSADAHALGKPSALHLSSALGDREGKRGIRHYESNTEISPYPVDGCEHYYHIDKKEHLIGLSANGNQAAFGSPSTASA